jgi:membrane-associated protease RseP (regulator of RpoE activity)
MVRLGARMIPGFLGEPVLHHIRPDGPGAGKLQHLDTLVAVDGQSITTPEAALRLYEGDGLVRLTLRNNGTREVTIAPGSICQKNVPTGFWTAFQPRTAGWFGLGLKCTGQCSEATIAAIEGTGPAARAGLRKGDYLLAIDGLKLSNAAAWQRMNTVRLGESVKLAVRRGVDTQLFKIAAGGFSKRDFVVGDASVSVTGLASVQHDSLTGVITVQVGNTTVTVRPSRK